MDTLGNGPTRSSHSVMGGSQQVRHFDRSVSVVDLTYSRWYVVGSKRANAVAVFPSRSDDGAKGNEQTFDQRPGRTVFSNMTRINSVEKGKQPVTVELLFRQRGASQQPFVTEVQGRASGTITRTATMSSHDFG